MTHQVARNFSKVGGERSASGIILSGKREKRKCSIHVGLSGLIQSVPYKYIGPQISGGGIFDKK